MNLRLEHIDKILESKVRLGIMAVLSVNESLDFKSLRTLLNLTDGNLVTHTRTLENAGYIVSTKQFVGRIPNTAYRATEAGREAFRRHLQALEQLIEAATKGPSR
ncbi:transcriptional regulator [uncultured Alistipes sp.]|uniref:winged helix-turn-helix domain-containing protein n=1 Tax=uncultured Alistipes sp. TaxID=538949 RepID=UPI00272AB92D|nr:transcriptional regulator [uncultured Alistipes sp.]